MKAHKDNTTHKDKKRVSRIVLSFISAYKREKLPITYHYLILPNSSFMFCVGQKLL